MKFEEFLDSFDVSFLPDVEKKELKTNVENTNNNDVVVESTSVTIVDETDNVSDSLNSVDGGQRLDKLFSVFSNDVVEPTSIKKRLPEISQDNTVPTPKTRVLYPEVEKDASSVSIEFDNISVSDLDIETAVQEDSLLPSVEKTVHQEPIENTIDSVDNSEIDEVEQNSGVSFSEDEENEGVESVSKKELKRLAKKEAKEKKLALKQAKISKKLTNKERKRRQAIAKREAKIKAKEDKKKNKKNKLPVKPNGRKPWFIVSIIGFSFFLIVGGIFLSRFLIFGKILVPSAPNVYAKNVCDRFVNVGLKCKSEFVYDNAIKDSLVGQSIPAKSKTREENIVLSYSKGQLRPVVPELAGLSFEDAKKSLYNIGLNVGNISFVDNSGIEKGRVVSVDSLGKSLRNGDKVNLRVASGKNIAPNWTNKDKTFVTIDSKKHNLDVEFVYETSNLPNDVVVSQSVKPGDKMYTNKIKVVLSQNNEQKKLEIPNVVGLSREDAELRLASVGFKKINIVSVKTSKVKDSKVTQIFPESQTSVLDNENIVIVVSVPE